MILLFAVAAGLIAALLRFYVERYHLYQWDDSAQAGSACGTVRRAEPGQLRSATSVRFTMPTINGGWYLCIAFVPQLLVFYLPITRQNVSDGVAAGALVVSQVLLLLFCWRNRRHRAFYLLSVGLLANFVVIVSNGGLMPMSPETLGKLVSAERAAMWQQGERIGVTKDRLLAEDVTRFAILSDRMVLPKWTGYAVAYSIGDVAIALGAFLFLWDSGKPGMQLS